MHQATQPHGKYAVSHRVTIAVLQLDGKSGPVVGFSGSSFENDQDLLTQLGHIILQVDRNNNSAPMSFKLYKLHLMTRSGMAGEVSALAEISGAAVMLAKEAGRLYNHRKLIQLLTKSKCLFEGISKGFCTSKKCLMLDIAAAHEQFCIKVISDIGLAHSADNLSDKRTEFVRQAWL